VVSHEGEDKWDRTSCHGGEGRSRGKEFRKAVLDGKRHLYLLEEGESIKLRKKRGKSPR